MIQRRQVCGQRYDESYFPKADFIFPEAHNVYELEEVHHWSAEYDTIKSKIDSDIFNVTRIERVKNTFLQKSFELKKIQYPEEEVEQLFHITSPKAATSICKHNFNWRLFGKRSKHHSRGQGVYFATSSAHAASFFERRKNRTVIFLVNVLVGKVCVGKKDMRLPSDGADASVDKIYGYEILTKYEDNVFYPTYKVTFTFKGDSNNQIVDLYSGSQNKEESSNIVTGLAVTAAVVSIGFFELSLYNTYKKNKEEEEEQEAQRNNSQ